MNSSELPPISHFVPSGSEKKLVWKGNLQEASKKNFCPQKGFANLAQNQDENHPFVFFCDPTPLSMPKLLALSSLTADLLGLQSSIVKKSNDWKQLLSGEGVIDGFPSYSTVYAGHQFGVFVPRLGDGRAINLGMLNGYELQLKGAGSTPYARHADGRAVLRSSIREFLCSEAMFGLGIPTTRALSIFTSKTPVVRESVELGSVVCRVSPSFVRFGNFEYFASQGMNASLLKLLNHIQTSHPQFKSLIDIDEKNLELKISVFLSIVSKNTAKLMSKWMSTGFMHGVMNTDNFSILSETIDYGPFGFMDSFDANHVCNHSDYQGRYSYNNQPNIALWNLHQLCNSFIGLTSQEFVNSLHNDITHTFSETFTNSFNLKIKKKLGFSSNDFSTTEWDDLVTDMFTVLQKSHADFTLFFRNLSQIIDIKNTKQINLNSFFNSLSPQQLTFNWIEKYYQLLNDSIIKESKVSNKSICEIRKKRKVDMNSINPAVVLRNWVAEDIIQRVNSGEFSIIEEALEVFKNPFLDTLDNTKWSSAPPEWSRDLEVSCSS